jgi:hypothetical protein
MKICILGNCHSIFISQLVKNMKKQKPEFVIDGIQMGVNKSFEFDNYFDKMFFLNNENISNIKILNKAIKYLRFKLEFRKMKRYDVVNIQFVNNFYKFFWSDIKKIADKIILSFWGSDFHRITEKERKNLIAILKEADFITFTSIGMAEEFKLYYSSSEISKKVRICRFGIESLDSILQVSNNQKNNFRKKYKITQNEIIVAVGYSAVKARRHIEIMNALLTLNDELLKKCHFVFQMNYGDMVYKNQVKLFLKSTNIKYIVLEDFMSYDEISEFRVETDVMLNLPDMDQFSASMQEILFAKNIVITGKWLPYNLLWNSGVFAVILENFDDLSKTFKNTIEDIDTIRVKCKNNSQKIYEISSWETNTKKWIDLYIDVLDNKKDYK